MPDIENKGGNRVAPIMLGPPHPLRDAPPGAILGKTHLIRIEDTNPRRPRVAHKVFERPLSDGEILTEFDGRGFTPLPKGSKSRLDIKVSDAARYTIVAFQLSDGHHDDRFIKDSADGATLAVCGGDPTAQEWLFEPRWVAGFPGPDQKTVRMYMKNGRSPEIQYGLGIEIEDGEDGNLGIPTFLDPKIENDGS